MNKYKIIALFGESGSGKDYIQKQIMNTFWGKTHLHKIISSTTRPPRENEKDGIDYHFIPTAAEFLNESNLKKWIEFAYFKTWWYGTSIDSLKSDKINIGIFNIKGINQILENDDIDCFPIRITCPGKIRLIRQLTRENNPNCHEITRRFLSDSEDFLHIPFHYYSIENITEEIQPILLDIIHIGKSMDKIN